MCEIIFYNWVAIFAWTLLLKLWIELQFSSNYHNILFNVHSIYSSNYYNIIFKDIKTRSHLYKAYIKPDIDYCLPVWGNHNTVEAIPFDKLLTRAKSIITRNITANLCNADFNTFCITDFTIIVYFLLLFAFLLHVHLNNNIFNSTFKILSDVEKPMATCAFDSFKLHTIKSKKSCDNYFLFTAPKLRNMLPNNVTCVTNFNAFRTSVVKQLFK